MSNNINVYISNRGQANELFVLIDPDSENAISVSSIDLHSSLYFVDLAIKRHFLDLFNKKFNSNKTECTCSSEAEKRIINIADWNAEFEDN